MPNQTEQRGAIVGRHADALVRSALADTRIVAIVGPRQSGKTTLARRITDDDGRQFPTLDDEQSRRFAADDPEGFARSLNRAAIDEIQRAPKRCPAPPRPGRRWRYCRRSEPGSDGALHEFIEQRHREGRLAVARTVDHALADQRGTARRH